MREFKRASDDVSLVHIITPPVDLLRHFSPFSQVDLSHGAAQALSASLKECPVIEKPSEDAGGQRGHQTRVHRAEVERGTAGEQEDEG